MELTAKARSMRDWLFAEWAEKLGAILESMADERPAATNETASGVPPPGDALVWRQSFATFPDPAIWIVVPHSTALDLGRRTLRSAGLETTEEADEHNTFLEILNQSFSALGQSIGSHLETETAAADGEPISEIPAEDDWVTIRLQFGENVLEPIWITCSAQMTQRLASPTGPFIAEPSKDTARAPVQPSPSVADSIEKLPSGGSSKTFDLLLDVALPVSISFGRTFLPIKDILKLTTGSIVELDRTVNEPVDVIINNCVIARGEVVVIEGNYGVRISQIASRYDRLRTGSALAQVKHAIGDPTCR